MKRYRWISLGLAFMLTFGTMPLQSMAAGNNGTEAAGAAGTKAANNSKTEAANATGTKTVYSTRTEATDRDSWEEIIEINTVEEFVSFAEQCSVDAWSVGKWVELKQDINLSGVDFPMIPVFSGTFEGGGHTISGFHNVGEGYIGGLFRYINQDGVVSNLKLKGSVEGTEEKECIGSICGINYGTIRNCSFTGTISGRDTVGGIAGTNSSTGFISGCSISGHVSGYYMTGGITGINHGVVTYCTNNSGINDDSEWVEQDDEMGTGLLLSISATDDDIEFFSGVDTGGIAGYSDGTISRCTNNGTVGYEHTGYNIGGIAGRQAGMVSLCVNNGRVYGRKDVGGIVGQMEPYIEVDEAESLRNAVNKLHDLIDNTLVDMQEGKDVMKADLDNLTSYGDAALESGHILANQLTDFVDKNVHQAQVINDRLEYIADQLPAVMDDLTDAMDAWDDFSKKMKNLMEELLDINIPDGGTTDGSDNTVGSGSGKNLSVAMKRMQNASGQIDRSMNKINEILTDTNGSTRQWDALTLTQQEELVNETLLLAGYLEDMTNASCTAQSELSKIDRTPSSDQIKKDLEDAMKSLQRMNKSLRNAFNGAKNIVNYISSQKSVRFALLGDDFKANSENLNIQLRGISDSLKNLSDNASAYSDLTNKDLRAVNDQLNIVFNLLADHLSGGNELSLEELYEEVSDEEIDSILSGRTDACTNKGIVKGDINIGGIAGSMSIDEEDPEDNAAGSINYEIGRRFIMKCIIDSCINEGYVTAKKDGAGGIVGYMGHGIVIDSEAYGSVESTEGGYVGGICGESLTVIRRCYALCDVSGGRNIGGIAGYAATLKDCCAITNVESSAGRMGSIAGQTADYKNSDGKEPDVCRNYYVDDTLYGIDNISYVGIAEPLSYQELLTVVGLPNAFRHLKVIYRVEDEYLGTEEIAFGESLDDLNYPKIPEKDGCYGVWPDYSGQRMSGNLVINAEYHDNVLVVESNEKTVSTEGAYDKPYALIEQIFTEDTRLTVSTSNEAAPLQATGKEYVMYHVRLENSGKDESDNFALRLLNPYKDAEVWSLSGTVWTKQNSKPRGQYMQVVMTGNEETFCVIRKNSYTLIIVAAVVIAAAVLLLLTVPAKFIRKKRISRKQVKAEKKE